MITKYGDFYQKSINSNSVPCTGRLFILQLLYLPFHVVDVDESSGAETSVVDVGGNERRGNSVIRCRSIGGRRGGRHRRLVHGRRVAL